MTLSTLFSALLYLLGIAAVIVGLRTLDRRGMTIDSKTSYELRRSARVARIDDFRNRRIVDSGSTWNSPDDPGPKAA